MAATRDKYLPEQTSERWFTPYTTCSLFSWYTGEFAATLGESIIWGTGQPYGVQALKTRFKRGWTAADHDRNDSGYGRVDFNNFMEGIGSPIRLDDVKFTRDRDDITAALDNNAVIVMAGNTKGCRPASPLRKYVNEVDHRMAFKFLRVKDGKKETRMYDPMTPYNDKAHWGKWVPLQDMFDFGLRFKHAGLFYAERFVSGHFTREAKARRNGAKAVLKVQERVVELQQELHVCQQVVAKKNERIEWLLARLEETVDRQELLILANEIKNAANEIETMADDIIEEVSVSPIP